VQVLDKSESAASDDLLGVIDVRHMPGLLSHRRRYLEYVH
jgi:hypothetical protein